MIVCSLPVPLSRGRDVEDAVGVDVEGHLDLRARPSARGDALEVELAEQAVVGGHRPLALEDLDRDGMVWLSSAVVKVSFFSVGIVVLRGTRTWS